MQNGNRTKKPCAADGGITGSNHAFRASWVTFEEARHAAEASSYSGVGFIISKGMYFLDIDHRDEADAMVHCRSADMTPTPRSPSAETASTSTAAVIMTAS